MHHRVVGVKSEGRREGSDSSCSPSVSPRRGGYGATPNCSSGRGKSSSSGEGMDNDGRSISDILRGLGQGRERSTTKTKTSSSASKARPSSSSFSSSCSSFPSGANHTTRTPGLPPRNIFDPVSPTVASDGAVSIPWWSILTEVAV